MPKAKSKTSEKTSTKKEKGTITGTKGMELEINLNGAKQALKLLTFKSNIYTYESEDHKVRVTIIK